MALFKSKKAEKETAVAKTPKVKKLSVAPVSASDDLQKSHLSEVLRRPRVTEKASMLTEKSVYVFDISPRAGKQEVSRAIKAFYGVSPERVHVLNTKAKKVFVRGKWGTKAGGKKAYVYLREGDKIEII